MSNPERARYWRALAAETLIAASNRRSSEGNTHKYRGDL